ncbi:hypothetical protein RUM43_009385 [Polyplax serrata]|uniref:Uncharacterized protein n=1 Tax=Polyplax serrata TaxID=468196 RepID=A0AAN8PAQ7_POLSC
MRREMKTGCWKLRAGQNGNAPSNSESSCHSSWIPPERKDKTRWTKVKGFVRVGSLKDVRGKGPRRSNLTWPCQKFPRKRRYAGAYKVEEGDDGQEVRGKKMGESQQFESGLRYKKASYE